MKDREEQITPPLFVVSFFAQFRNVEQRSQANYLLLPSIIICRPVIRIHFEKYFGQTVRGIKICLPRDYLIPRQRKMKREDPKNEEEVLSAISLLRFWRQVDSRIS